MTRQVTRAHCNKCSNETQHDVLREVKTEWEDGVDPAYGASIWGGDAYELIQCRGCESVCLRHKSWFSEDRDDRNQPAVQTHYYPPAAFRTEPKWLTQLMLALPINDQSAHDLLKEIYIALHSDSRRLALMGIRALLEHVMIDKNGKDRKSFKANLDTFEDGGFVSAIQRSVLEPVIEAGHAVMHRSFNPSTQQVVACLDVVENIIEAIYINEGLAESLALIRH